MARKKLANNKKKPKIGITINQKLSELMEDYITKENINRSKYIENLIRKDIESKGLNINPDFEI